MNDETTMTRVLITSAAARAIDDSRDPTRRFVSTAKLEPNGLVSVELSADTVMRLWKHAAPGESLSDTIVRLCSTAGKPLN